MIVYENGVFTNHKVGGAEETVPLQVAAGRIPVGSNTSVLAAISGKRFRIIGYDFTSSTAVLSTILFKSNSGGSTIMNYRTMKADQTPVDKPNDGMGYFETSTGHGLFADVGGTSVDINVYYVTYTP